MTPTNSNLTSFTDRTRDFIISSRNYIVDITSNFSSASYEYSQNKLEAARVKIAPYIPNNIVKCGQTAGAVVVTGVIAGVALRALVTLATHLPVVDTIAGTVVAGYALTHRDRCAQGVALFAIGSVVVKTLALPTCSLPVTQAFALYIAAIGIVDYVKKGQE